MRALLQRILIASQWGASLVLVAGCSSSVSGGTGGAGGSAGTGGSVGISSPPPSGSSEKGNRSRT